MDEQKGQWAYNPEDDGVNSSVAPPLEHKPAVHKEITWSASEFIDHHKNMGWYVALFLGVGIFTAIVYLLTKDLMSVLAITTVSALFAMLAGRKPRELPYRLDNRGVTIGDKFYSFSAFKSFALHQDGAVGYISFIPLKRFMPEVSIYFPPDESEKIIDILSDSLPNEQRKENGVDVLMRRLRF